MNVMLYVAINPKMSSTHKDSIFQIRIPLFVLFIYKTRINKGIQTNTCQLLFIRLNEYSGTIGSCIFNILVTRASYRLIHGCNFINQGSSIAYLS